MAATRVLRGLALPLLVAGACTRAPPPERAAGREVPLPAPTGTPPVLVGAGDIASCPSSGDEATAAILDTIPGIIFTAGDNVYGSGSAHEFARCYDPSWGRHRARTRPAPGNHDHRTAHAAAYFAYFGANAGPAGRGYYSYDLGAWHVIVLDSEIPIGRRSAQLAWLARDLAAHAASPGACTAMIDHRPRFSSGPHGNDGRMRDAWDLLYARGVELAISGHDHLYERFAPQTPGGQLDVARGIRQFVVGTGGTNLYVVRRVRPNSEVRIDDRLGVLRLELEAHGYRWSFITAPGGEVGDSGSGECH